MAESKLRSMRDAIAEFVPDGSSVVLGTALESLIPFSAGHEIIRQHKKGLSLIGPISDMLFDQLIGGGCANKVIAAWVGNVSAGLAHNYRRAFEEQVPNRIEIQDHSNFTIALALLGGSLGSPYIATKTALGSDLLRTNQTLHMSVSPLNGERVLLVPALNPDVAILNVQRSDEEGNAQAWGNLGISEEAFLASSHVIIVAEEIVPRETIVSDPNRVLGPSLKVSAVVHEPGGAHPSPVQGYYNRDHHFYHEYHHASRTRDGFLEWLDRWVLGTKDREDFFQKLGMARWSALQKKESRFAARVDYGY